MEEKRLVSVRKVWMEVEDLELDTEARDIEELIQSSVSANTRKVYDKDIARFEAWCSAQGIETFIPTSTLLMTRYIRWMAMVKGYAVATIRRSNATIFAANQAAGHPFNTKDEPFYRTWQGIKNTHGKAQRRAAAAVLDVLQAMLAVLPSNLLGVRDKALLLVGFAGALRRQEVVALDAEKLRYSPRGVAVFLPKRKTDQERKGTWIGIPYGKHEGTCPVKALQSWLTEAKITEGPVFRVMDRHMNVYPDRLSDKAVYRAIKAYAEKAGYDPTAFSGHSLRRGFGTQARLNGADLQAIMKQTGHRSAQEALKYIEEGDLFINNAAEGLGL